MSPVAAGLLRPPGARGERDFLARCIHCGRCAEVCPHGSIHMAAGVVAGFFGLARNTPYIHARTVPCWLCMKCPAACPSGALRPVKDMAAADMGVAVLLKERCHNWVGSILCRTCYDKCPLRGTAIILQGGDVPEVADACVGCGVCEHVCPVDAIIVRPGAGRRAARTGGDGLAGEVPRGAGDDRRASGAVGQENAGMVAHDGIRGGRA